MKAILFFLPILLLLMVAGFAQTTTDVLTLDDCIETALKNNPQLKISKNQLEIAEQTYKQSYSNILPSVDVSASYGRFFQAPSEYAGGTRLPQPLPEQKGDNYSTNLNVQQNIFDGGFWWNNISKTRSDKRSQEYSYLSERQRTIVNVQQAYFTLVKELKLLEVRKQAVHRSERQVERTTTQYELGAVAKVDVFQARTNLGNDRIALLTQKNAVLKARQDLNLFMGRDPQEPLEIVTDVEVNLTVGNLDSLINAALANNPALKQLEQNYQSAKLQTSLATSTYWPRVGIFYRFSRQTPEFESIFGALDKNYNWFAGLNISWNLFRGFDDYRNRQKAKINEQIARENIVDSRRNIISQVKALSDNLSSYLEIIKINKENLESAKEQYRLAQERYRVGSGTQLEVREAQVNLTQAEQILVGAENNAIITYAQLLEAIGYLSTAY